MPSTILTKEPVPGFSHEAGVLLARDNLNLLMKGIEEVVQPTQSACLIWSCDTSATVNSKVAIYATVELCEVATLPKGFIFHNGHSPQEGLPHVFVSRVKVEHIFVCEKTIHVPEDMRPLHNEKSPESATREIGLRIRRKAMGDPRTRMLVVG